MRMCVPIYSLLRCLHDKLAEPVDLAPNFGEDLECARWKGQGANGYISAHIHFTALKICTHADVM